MASNQPAPTPQLLMPAGASHRTKAVLAYDALRDAVLQGRIRPGERLTTMTLCSMLGMSSTPVREAIRRLEAEGLLVNEPHRGVTVNDLDGLDTDEFFAMRPPMESLATRLATPQLTPADLAALADIHAELEHAAAKRDDDELTSANARWHMTIYAACPKRAIVLLVQQLWMPFHWSSVRYWPMHDDLRKATVREHAEIMAALSNRDAERAGQLMREHITRVHEEVMRRQREHDAAGNPATSGPDGSAGQPLAGA